MTIRLIPSGVTMIDRKALPGVTTEEDRRRATMQAIFDENEWLTAEMINALQPSLPSNTPWPASDWKRHGRIFGVSLRGEEYFARYQFDAKYQPLPIIEDILKALGPVADPWKVAAWFHFPNGWIAAESAVAPKNALNRVEDVLAAARKRRGSYVA
jgi:hypothetical protein